MSLKLKKEAELHAISAGVALPTPDPARLTIAVAITQFKEDLTMLDRKDQTLGAYDLVFTASAPRVRNDGWTRSNAVTCSSMPRKCGRMACLREP